MANIRTVDYRGFNYATGSGPSGFALWSGSWSLSQSATNITNYEGIGAEFISDGNNFLRFRTEPQEFIVKSENFFLGGTDQFVSGAAGNIEISSSNFHLGNDGSVVMQGSITATAGGTIGGWVIGTNALSSSNNNVMLSSAGPYHLSSSGFQVDTGGNITASAGIIGGFALTSNKINSGTDLILSSSGEITGSKVLFTGGKIAGFDLSGNTLTATNFTLDASGKRLSLGTGNTIFIADADDGIHLGNSTFGSAPFNVSTEGVMTASLGLIGGWDIGSDSLVGGNLQLFSDGRIKSSDYVSNQMGFLISAASGGFIEAENAKIRGTLSTAVFEKETVNAVGGQLYIANSTTLTGSGQLGGSTTELGFHSATDTTMSVVNVTGFAVGEILSAKRVTSTGFSTEYLLVESSSRDNGSSETDFSGKIHVQRAYGSGTTGDSGSLGGSPGAAQEYSGSQVIVSTGKLGTGYIRLNANPNDQTTPYIDIVERTGSGIYDVKLKARLGDLSGVANTGAVNTSTPGFGLYSENVFLEGGIVASTGSIAGIEIEDGKIYTGTGTHANNNTGFYIDSGSNFSLGDKLTWDGSTLNVSGQISIGAGSTLPDGTSINSVKTVNLSATENIIVYNAAGDNGSGTITLIASSSNFTDARFKFTGGGGAFTDETTFGDGLTANTDTATFTVPTNYSSTPYTFNVSVQEGTSGGEVASDTITIASVKPGTAGSDGADGADGSDGADGADGADAFTIVFSNETHTLPASSGGIVSSYVGSGTTISVFEGATELDYDGSGTTAGHWKVVYASQVPASTLTFGSISDGGNNAVIGDHSAMSNTVDSVVITYTITGQNLNGDAFSFTKTQTISKATAGSDGATGPAGATGATGPNFSFLTGSLDQINTTGGIGAGLLMTSTSFGFHSAIAEGDGTNATLNDFSTYMDYQGNFFLGSGSGTLNSYLAWNQSAGTLEISGSGVDFQVKNFFMGDDQQFISGSGGNIEISSSNFRLDPQGSTTQSAGVIGAWTIDDSKLVDKTGNIELNASESYIRANGSYDYGLSPIRLNNVTAVSGIGTYPNYSNSTNVSGISTINKSNDTGIEEVTDPFGNTQLALVDYPTPGGSSDSGYYSTAIDIDSSYDYVHITYFKIHKKQLSSTGRIYTGILGHTASAATVNDYFDNNGTSPWSLRAPIIDLNSMSEHAAYISGFSGASEPATTSAAFTAVSQSNPYHSSPIIENLSWLVEDRWYCSINYLYKKKDTNYSNNTRNFYSRRYKGGIYDTVTGNAMLNTNPKGLRPNTNSITLRSFMYTIADIDDSSVDGSIKVASLLPPRLYKIDGTEPSIAEIVNGKGSKIDSEGTITANNVTLTETAAARVIHNRTIIIDKDNKYKYFKKQKTGANFYAELFLDGSLGGQVSSHVILDLDCSSTLSSAGIYLEDGEGGASGADHMIAIGEITGPSGPQAVDKANFTIEVASGRTVQIADIGPGFSLMQALLIANPIAAAVAQSTSK